MSRGVGDPTGDPIIWETPLQQPLAWSSPVQVGSSDVEKASLHARLLTVFCLTPQDTYACWRWRKVGQNIRLYCKEEMI